MVTTDISCRGLGRMGRQLIEVMSSNEMIKLYTNKERDTHKMIGDLILQSTLINVDLTKGQLDILFTYKGERNPEISINVTPDSTVVLDENCSMNIIQFIELAKDSAHKNLKHSFPTYSPDEFKVFSILNDTNSMESFYDSTINVSLCSKMSSEDFLEKFGHQNTFVRSYNICEFMFNGLNIYEMFEAQDFYGRYDNYFCDYLKNLICYLLFNSGLVFTESAVLKALEIIKED